MTTIEQPTLLQGYEDALDNFKLKMSEHEVRCEAIKILSDRIEQIRDQVLRNELLDIRQKLNSLKSQSERCNKLVKSSIDWANNAILLRLTEEELDNYSRNGKLFYPSTQTYVSVADRVALEDYVKTVESLDIFGNGLNKEYVLNVIESTGAAPSGVNTYQKTRLNVRTK